MTRTMTNKVVPLRDGQKPARDAETPYAAELRRETFEGPQPFPLVSKVPRIPPMIPDEILEYYGWVFCQGGFSNLHMTFEQFLTVVAKVSPSGLCPECGDLEFDASAP